MVGPTPEYWMAMRALAALAFTLGLLLTLAWAWRTYGARWGLPTAKLPQQRIRVVESKRLNTHTTLMLVQVDDAEHLIATSAAQTTVISTRPHKPAAPKSAKLRA